MSFNSEQLLARSEINDVLTAYCHAQDQNEWRLAENIFTSDAVVELPGTSLGQMAASEFLSFLRYKFTPHRLSGQHSLSNILFTIEGEQARTVSEVSYFTLEFTEQEGVLKRTRGNCIYVDDLVRVDGEWRIAHRVIAQKNIETNKVTYPSGLIAAIRIASEPRWLKPQEANL